MGSEIVPAQPGDIVIYQTESDAGNCARVPRRGHAAPAWSNLRVSTQTNRVCLKRVEKR